MGYYSRKLFNMYQYNLQPFVAPDNFDPTSQPVNIYEKFKELHQIDNTAAFIWYYASINSLVLSTTTDITWRYGETINGTETISSKISSGTIFTSGSTKRWICGYYTENADFDLNIRYLDVRWLYIYSDKCRCVTTADSSINLYYIHLNNRNIWNSITYYNFKNHIGLTGTLTLPETLTSVEQYAFYGANAISKVNCYAMVAPTTNNSTFAFGGTPRPLHVPIGSSGYNVAPWTDTSIFSSIIADL